MPINEWSIHVVYAYEEILPAMKRNEVLTHATSMAEP